MMRGGNKSILIGAFIGFVYALIPFLIFTFSNSEGSYILFLIPPFILAGWTLYISTIIMGSIYNLFSPEFSFSLAYNIFNLVLWLLIGAGVAIIVNKIREIK